MSIEAYLLPYKKCVESKVKTNKEKSNTRRHDAANPRNFCDLEKENHEAMKHYCRSRQTPVKRTSIQKRHMQLLSRIGSCCTDTVRTENHKRHGLSTYARSSRLSPMESRNRRSYYHSFLFQTQQRHITESTTKAFEVEYKRLPQKKKQKQQTTTE